ncbi:transcriptional regulator PhoU, partial [Oleibacter sp. HI0075]
DDVDKAEVAIDNECTQILVRRQPAASDLRMVLAVSRVVRDLERIGDEASKIAIHTLEVKDSKNPQFCQQAIRYMGEEVVKMISGALDAFARHDVEGAIEVVRTDKLVDKQYASALRELITYMMEDPRSIGQAINILWILRAIERIGDHARNISEQVIYLVSGTDVRHSSLTEMEETAQKED